MSKVEPAIDLVLKLIDENTTKVLVFAHHITVVDTLQMEFNHRRREWYKDEHLQVDHNRISKQSILVKGAMSHMEREDAFRKFKGNEDCQVAFLSHSCCSVGLNLSCADYVIFVEIPNCASLLAQAEDRANRLGRAKDAPPVQVYILVAQDNEMDSRHWQHIASKQYGLEESMDGKDVGTMDVKNIQDGLENIQAPKQNDDRPLKRKSMASIASPTRTKDILRRRQMLLWITRRTMRIHLVDEKGIFAEAFF
eukprot:TRINITY_DN1848_c0_g1_i1.p1 TRINITY_DN1848_c0_g1~~TRINITY_DN1848_c0_g1_i1.p1  ORF type:complete len:252 (+),score=41.52 TRINITY_DN1848_c0_g1_i1:158-913(+)